MHNICEGFSEYKTICKLELIIIKTDVLEYICKGDETRAGAEVLPLKATLSLFASMLAAA